MCGRQESTTSTPSPATNDNNVLTSSTHSVRQSLAVAHEKQTLYGKLVIASATSPTHTHTKQATPLSFQAHLNRQWKQIKRW